eukprot:GHVS01009366.1.p1 GENE.GHVS01009366.1~~GHVS01009366.1.p1  ORF type:complete len:491 (+),score=92.27 GHVS01009366.1:92-1564(+)
MSLSSLRIMQLHYLCSLPWLAPLCRDWNLPTVALSSYPLFGKTSPYFSFPSSSCFFSSVSSAPMVRLSVSQCGQIGVVTLDRPQAKNALSKRLLQELRQMILSLQHPPTSLRLLLVRSAVAGVFCAGADLKERAGMSASDVRGFVSVLRGTMEALDKLPLPTIACIDGAALGGGLEVALACDFRCAGAKALVGLPETALAIIPGAGGTQRLPRLVGAQKAKFLIMTARKMLAPDALQFGVLDFVEGENEHVLLGESKRRPAGVCGKEQVEGNKEHDNKEALAHADINIDNNNLLTPAQTQAVNIFGSLFDFESRAMCNSILTAGGEQNQSHLTTTETARLHITTTQQTASKDATTADKAPSSGFLMDVGSSGFVGGGREEKKEGKVGASGEGRDDESEGQMGGFGFSGCHVNAVKEYGFCLGLLLASQMLDKGPVALQAAKRAIADGMQTDLASSMDIERINYDKVLNTHDRLEALEAFKNKRKPVFRGL